MFLRGLGGAVVAAPFLSSLWQRNAKSQAPANPRQLIVMFTHYGCITTKWFPQKSHGPLTSGDLTNSLAPLAPYAGKLLLPRGMRAMNEWTQNNTGPGHGLGQGNDPFQNAMGSYFTLQPLTPNSNDPFSFDEDTKFTPRPVGPSIDQVMAQQLASGGTPLLMRVGNVSWSSTDGTLSYQKTAGAAYSDGATAFPGLGTVTQIFSALTGVLIAGASPSPDSYAATRGKLISDLVKGDLDGLKRMDMSADDKNKLAAWESLLNDTGAIVTTSNQCGTELAGQLGATQANVTATSMRTPDTDTLTMPITSDLDGADMYSVMAVLSAICNYNPVMLLKYPPNFLFTGLGLTTEAGGLSQRTGNGTMTGPCVPDVLGMLRTIDTYHATKFAKLVGMLDGIRNPDGSTVLDNTATVWFQEYSDGAAHNLNNLPIIQAGGCGGYFKTGWTINVDTTDTGSATLTQGNSEAQCDDGTADQQVNDLSQSLGTGTPAAIASAPINKYYYNLMNALGVKGDSNGYPDGTGTGPVTRFGYSDLTTDFCGGLGGVAGATIHSPGEFTALKA